jgi:prevent-host-death family protein
MAFYGHIFVMKTVSVAALKNQLSAYLHAVQEGEEICITSHSRPVARLVPEKKESSPFPLQIPDHPLRSLKQIKGVKSSLPFDPLEYLWQDRER